MSNHRIEEDDMKLIQHNPADLFPPYRGYVHAAEIIGASRMLFISGLNGYERDGASMPEAFTSPITFM